MGMEEEAQVSLNAYIHETSLSQLCALSGEDAHQKHQHRWFHYI